MQHAKKLAIATMLLFTLAFTGNKFVGGGATGLYSSFDDFRQHRLSYEQDCSNGSRIKLHGLFGSASFDLIAGRERHSFSKDSIYGYRDCNAQDYRFFANSQYRMLDTSGFFLYSCTKLVQGEKIARSTTLTFFSVKGNAPIQELTIEHLEKAFAANARFCYLVRSAFRQDAELADYDKVLKMYRLKYLYHQSTN